MIVATTLLLAVFVSAEAPRVQNAILGVRIGSAAADVKANLSAHGTGESRPTRDGGTKQVWTLKDTPFSSLALKTDAAGRVVWVTGFIRPDQEIPFKELGDLARASAASATRVVWDVATPDGGYRLIARGSARRAQTISLLSFDREPEN
jgi:hypothetical protein